MKKLLKNLAWASLVVLGLAVVAAIVCTGGVLLMQAYGPVGIIPYYMVVLIILLATAATNFV